ncbi:MAG TPA: glycosyltransferase [Candidatus Binataceae bacterium]|nr:glycosyltransferase [Candidatus Binataceae bacterium]
MRTLHIVAGRLYGGVESQLVTRAKFRSSCPEMEPEFALCFDGLLRERLLEQMVPVHMLGVVRARNPLQVIRARRRLYQVLRDRNIDVVAFEMPWALALFGPVARSAGVPLVFWMHGPATGRHWVERWAKFTRPDLAICNSKFTASTLPTLYPGMGAVVITYPVAPPQSHPLREDRLAVRRELETPPDAIVIAQVCRMEPWKGHRLHLEALSRLRDLPGWICWIVGGAQRRDELRYEAELRAAARSFGIADRVRFVGERQDVSRLLHAADIYCQPNTGPEPFGIAVVEALHAGLPVVTSAMGGALEIIDPEVGFLTEPSPDAVAAALKQLIEDGRMRAGLGAAGPARARQLADPDVQILRLKQVLDELVARHGRGLAAVAAL